MSIPKDGFDIFDNEQGYFNLYENFLAFNRVKL